MAYISEPRSIWPTLDQIIITILGTAFVTAILGVIFSSAISTPITQKFVLPDKAVIGKTSSANSEEASFEIGTTDVLRVSEPYSVYRLDLNTKALSSNSWAYGEVELLDANKKYLLSFGKEHWRESGNDDGGYWEEADQNMQVKFTLNDVGDYYLRVKGSANTKSVGYELRVQQLVGSSLPMSVATVFLLILGVVLNECKRASIIKILRIWI